MPCCPSCSIRSYCSYCVVSTWFCVISTWFSFSSSSSSILLSKWSWLELVFLFVSPSDSLKSSVTGWFLFGSILISWLFVISFQASRTFCCSYCSLSNFWSACALLTSLIPPVMFKLCWIVLICSSHDMQFSLACLFNSPNFVCRPDNSSICVTQSATACQFLSLSCTCRFSFSAWINSWKSSSVVDCGNVPKTSCLSLWCYLIYRLVSSSVSCDLVSVVTWISSWKFVCALDPVCRFSFHLTDFWCLKWYAPSDFLVNIMMSLWFHNYVFVMAPQCSFSWAMNCTITCASHIFLLLSMDSLTLLHRCFCLISCSRFCSFSDCCARQSIASFINSFPTCINLAKPGQLLKTCAKDIWACYLCLSGTDS